MSSIVIREPLSRDAEQLAAMLNEDNGLRADLGIVDSRDETPQHFLEYVRDWCHKNHAVTYIIVHGAIAVGTISLSHQTPDGKKAKIGYWIGTEYRRKGYCGLAFDAVIKQAINQNIQIVSATIAKTNIPSRRVWEKRGGKAIPHDSPVKQIWEINLKEY